MTIGPIHKVLILVGLACLGLIVFTVLDTSGVLTALQDGKTVQRYIESWGIYGPTIIVLLLTLAILVSPLPSAPIAIASGAAYGHTWGTIYVIVGSLSGASGAFVIARYLGYDFIQKIAKDNLPSRFFNSQQALMGVVFISRLMPFLSFDMISYAAGLSSLTFGRFFVATLFGIAPASFFLAHVGSEMVSAEINRIAIAILLFTMLAGITLLINLFRKNN